MSIRVLNATSALLGNVVIPAASPFTLQMRVRSSVSTGFNAGIASAIATSPSNLFYFRRANYDGNWAAISGAAVNLDIWEMITFASDGTTLDMFVDNQLSVTGTFDISTFQTEINRAFAQNGVSMDFGEIRLYNAKLSPAAIAANYNVREVPNAANLIKLLPLDEGFGTTLNDIQTNTTQIDGDLNTASWLADEPFAAFLSNLVSVIVDDSEVTFTFQTAQSGGTAYVVGDTAANTAGLTNTQIKNGHKNNDTAARIAGNVAVSAVGTVQITVSALALLDQESFEIFVLQNNVNGDSNILTDTIAIDGIYLGSITTPIDESAIITIVASWAGTTAGTLQIQDQFGNTFNPPVVSWPSVGEGNGDITFLGPSAFDNDLQPGPITITATTSDLVSNDSITSELNVDTGFDYVDVSYVDTNADNYIEITGSTFESGDILAFESFLRNTSDDAITAYPVIINPEGLYPQIDENTPAGDYYFDAIGWDQNDGTWGSVGRQTLQWGGAAPGVSGPSTTTLGQTETYTMSNMSNPVTATYNGASVTVDNTNFPNVDVTFPDFNDLPGTNIQLDTAQQLVFNDGTNTPFQNVILAKDAADFQTVYVTPPAAGSIGENEPSATDGDIFLVRDVEGNITGFTQDTTVTYTGQDYNYNYTYFNVSGSVWTSITNESFTAPEPEPEPEPGDNFMTISTAVDQSAVGRVVGLSTNFKNLRQGSILNLPQRIVVIGQGASASTYTTDKRQVTSALEAAQLYGFGSPVHLAVKQLLPANGDGVGTIPVTVYPLLDDVSGVAATGTITPAGTITEAASFRVAVNNILSEEFVVSVGDTVADIVTAATTAINAVLDMPVIAADNVTAVGLTSKWEGVSANDIFVEIVGSQTLGVTYSIVQPTGGLTNPDVDVALNQIGNVWETMVLNCLDIADTTTLGKYQTFGAGRWGALVRKPLVVFTGNTATTVAAATAVSDARKTDYVNAQLVAPASNDLPLVVAGRQLARIAVVANNNPPQDYGSQKATGLTPGTDGNQWLYTARDVAVKAGSSTIEVKDGVVNLGDVVTFYHPDGDPIPAYRYVVDIVKLQNVIYNIDLEFSQPEWDGAPLIPDNQPTTNRSAKKPKSAVAAVASIIDSLGLAAIISDTKTAKENVSAAINDQNPKRLDIAITIQLSGNTNIISIDLNFGFFFGTAQVVS